MEGGILPGSTFYCLPKADYVVKPIKFRDVGIKTIVGGSALAMFVYVHFPP